MPENRTPTRLDAEACLAARRLLAAGIGPPWSQVAIGSSSVWQTDTYLWAFAHPAGAYSVPRAPEGA